MGGAIRDTSKKKLAARPHAFYVLRRKVTRPITKPTYRIRATSIWTPADVWKKHERTERTVEMKLTKLDRRKICLAPGQSFKTHRKL